MKVTFEETIHVSDIKPNHIVVMIDNHDVLCLLVREYDSNGEGLCEFKMLNSSGRSTGNGYDGYENHTDAADLIKAVRNSIKELHVFLTLQEFGVFLTKFNGKH